MTFAELLSFLDKATPYGILDQTPENTLARARCGEHKSELVGRIIKDMFLKSGLRDVNSSITRAQAVTAIGPIRLAFMKDDAPIEDFRTVEKIVHAIDGAFNEEALRLKQRNS